MLKALDEAMYRIERANHMLTLARNQAETAFRLKQQFAQSVSHALRMPLNLILSFIELMIQSPKYYGGPLPSAYLRELSIVHRNASYLQTLINDVLDMARIQAAQMSIQPEETDPAELVQEVGTMTRSLIEARGLHLRLEVQPGLPRPWIEPIRIRQVLLNLVNNAARFTEAGHVTVRAHRDGEAVTFAVADTGIGISAADLPRVFNEFEQVATGTRGAGGTGLGLAISRAFVELHGGRIWAESEGMSGRGSTFSFSLPATRTPLLAPPLTEASAAPAAVSLKPSDQPILLAVTASPTAATLLTRYVRGHRADFVVHRLTGALATDYSLAGRTFAFRLDRKTWDGDWLREWALETDLFPPALPSGQPAGKVTPEHERLGLRDGTPVAVAGHDHLCGAFAAGVTAPGRVFDSMGTAETLIGALPERQLTRADYDTGLMYGCHTARGHLYWMGGLSASGGSVEWLRALPPTPLTYADLEALLDSAPHTPSGLLYFPYLLGSGAPHAEASARGALIGLTAAHSLADLLQAVLEGAAYEIEFIRRAGAEATGQSIEQLIAAGGGVHNRRWLQIEADVSNYRLEVLAQPEATLLGAALLAGLGCGLYAEEREALAAVAQAETETFLPDAGRHAVYRRLFEGGYLKLQTPLREYFQWLRLNPATS